MISITPNFTLLETYCLRASVIWLYFITVLCDPSGRPPACEPKPGRRKQSYCNCRGDIKSVSSPAA